MPHRRFLSLTATFALLIALLPAMSHAAASDEPDKPTFFGMASPDWPTDFLDFEADVGSGLAFYQDFWSLDNQVWPNAWAPNRLTIIAGQGLTTYIEITTNDVVALNAGQRDAELAAMADLIADWLNGDPSRRLVIAPLPESNNDVHPWADGPTHFQNGYHRIRDAILDTGLDSSQVRWVFGMNGWSSPGRAYSQYYPGSDFVDIVGFSKLNRGDAQDGWRDYEETFTMHILEMQQTVGLAMPIIVTQTGSVDDAEGTRTEWLTDMMTRIPEETQVIGLMYFNRDKVELGVLNDYRILQDGTVDPAVVDNYHLWSSQDDVEWIFDGRMDDWKAWRLANLAGFLDTTGHTFEDEIGWLIDNGITAGCAELMYCPDDLVTRAQMATFLDRALDFPGTAIDFFTDDDGSTHEAAINRMAAFGVTLGCGDGAYCPSESITRAQMAAFLDRALALPDSVDNWFSDDDGLTLEPSINAVADAGVTLGCSAGLYCPDDFVTRGQMAAFLFRALTG